MAVLARNELEVLLSTSMSLSHLICSLPSLVSSLFVSQPPNPLQSLRETIWLLWLLRQTCKRLLWPPKLRMISCHGPRSTHPTPCDRVEISLQELAYIPVHASRTARKKNKGTVLQGKASLKLSFTWSEQIKQIKACIKVIRCQLFNPRSSLHLISPSTLDYVQSPKVIVQVSPHDIGETLSVELLSRTSFLRFKNSSYIFFLDLLSTIRVHKYTTSDDLVSW